MMLTAPAAPGLALTDEQRAAVEWPTGPLMVLAGAGTGKTTVIVERVAHLLASDPALRPEHILVLTYNVKAAAELTERFERRLGFDDAARLWVQNFHSFGHRVMQENRAELGLPPAVDVLDPIGQRLLLREIRPTLDLLYYAHRDRNASLGQWADLISRAKDELVSPADYAAVAESRRVAFEQRVWPDTLETCIESLRNGTLGPAKWVRPLLSHPNADHEVRREAKRQARREVRGDGYAGYESELTPEQFARHQPLWPTFMRDAEALEVVRLQEEARIYAAYQQALHDRGALDFGEQILRLIDLFRDFPNVLRRYQEQFRHVLVDEFQDANVAQIVLLELIGRAPGRPANVVVVGDDDQSIYRFRGASYAAFQQFRERFGGAPAWDPEAPPQTVAELPLLRNRRSSGRILSAAGRLITNNQARLKAGMELATDRETGTPVEIVVAQDEADEADAIVEWIRNTRPARWSGVAVLYRRHRHRELIVDRLRRANIPYQAVGGVGLFAHPEVRDLEAALRTAANPYDSASFTRVLSAPPWRFDAAQIVRLTRAAAFDESPVFEAAAKIRRAGELVVDVVEPEVHFDADGHPVDPPAKEAAPTLWAPAEVPTGPIQAGQARRDQKRADRRREKLDTALRVKLERVMGLFDELSPRAHREGAFTMLEAYLTGTHLLYDLIATGTNEAQRSVLVIARFMRFVSDWQRDHPRSSLADFVAYLDLYQEVGGDLDMDGQAQTQVDGVQLMTVYQAKGLEYDVVVVPRLVQGEFPDERSERLLIPLELLRQQPPAEFDVAEERRLLYVAMTRARERLLLTSIDHPSGKPRSGRFIGEVAGDPDAPPADVLLERRIAIDAVPEGEGATPAGAVDPTAATQKLLPIPTEFERRFSLRRRAVELIGALEGLAPDDAAGRDALIRDLVAVAETAAREGPEERLADREPVTLTVLGGHSPAGAGLLELVPLPPAFSHSQLRSYQECALRYAFERVYQIPVDETKSYFAFGHVMHSAFETFTVARRTARALGRPDPGFEVLESAYRAAMTGAEFPDRQSRDHYEGKADTQLRRFFERERESRSEALLFETSFMLALDPRDGSPPVRLAGIIDRVDRRPDGTIEVIDYKTGRPQTQGKVDVDEQLTTYALAIREGAVRDPETGARLRAPGRLTLYFTESDTPISTTRSVEQLDAHRDALLATARRMRSGDFAASPEMWKCKNCDYRRICPSRWGGTSG